MRNKPVKLYSRYMGLLRGARHTFGQLPYGHFENLTSAHANLVQVLRIALGSDFLGGSSGQHKKKLAQGAVGRQIVYKYTMDDSRE